MLIIGYKPAKLPRIPALELDGWVIAHRRLNKKTIPIEENELTLMGKQIKI